MGHQINIVLRSLKLNLDCMTIRRCTVFLLLGCLGEEKKYIKILLASMRCLGFYIIRMPG